MPSLYDLMKSAEKAKKAKKAAERPVDDGAAANAAAAAAVNRKYGSFVLCVSGERGAGTGGEAASSSVAAQRLCTSQCIG